MDRYHQAIDPNTVVLVPGFTGSYSNSDYGDLEVDSYYLDSTFNIVRVSVPQTLYTPTSPPPGTIRPTEFWTFSGGGSVIVIGKCDTSQIPVYPDRTETINLLAVYGIAIADDGYPWSDQELRAILIGATRIGEAFRLAGVSGGTRRDIFRNVMLNGDPSILFLRLPGQQPPSSPWDYYYTSEGGGVNNGNCKFFIGQSSRTIACRGSLANGGTNPPVVGEITQHAAVHELGHLFDYRSGPSQNQLRDAMEDPTGHIIISDCTDPQSVVMGYYPLLARWTKGTRGWGSSGFSSFQQNLSDTIEETAADMFLNWVYRRTSDNPPNTSLCDVNNLSNQTVGGWEGFRNINGRSGFDDRLPGNARYIWMDSQMNRFLIPWK